MAGTHQRVVARNEDGFTILESTIALFIVFAVLMGMLATLHSSVRGVVTGRQRTTALALANEVLEHARSLDFYQVGHKFTDPTLLADPAISPTENGHQVDPDADGPFPVEPLASSSNPAAPFTPHRHEEEVQGRTYARTVYVTLVEPEAGDPYKRITVSVSWTDAQYDPSAVADEIRLSSFLYPAVEPPDPLLVATADGDAGKVRITGTIQNFDLREATLWLPHTWGEIQSRFIRKAQGFAGSPHSLLSTNGALSSDDYESGGACVVFPPLKLGECAGKKAESVADNDSGTAPAEHDVVEQTGGVSGTVRRKNIFALTIGANNSVVSRSTSQSCVGCFAGAVDDDSLPWHQSVSVGPSSIRAPFTIANVDGSLVSADAVARATSTVDRQDAGTDRRITATSRVQHPSLKILTFSDPVFKLLGLLTFLPTYDGLVKISASDVTAIASAGPGVSPPTLTATPVTVQMWNPTTLGYTTHTLTPGVAASFTTSDSFVIEGLTVVAQATVTSRPKVMPAPEANGSEILQSEATMTNWLEVVLTFRIASGNTTYADLLTDVDWGRISSTATYEPVNR